MSKSKKPKKPPKGTGREAASDAGRLLRSPSTPADVRVVAGSDLAQVPDKKSKRPK
jgi:hypothetical protein